MARGIPTARVGAVAVARYGGCYRTDGTRAFVCLNPANKIGVLSKSRWRDK